jgi:hypothetical protein
MIAGGLLGWGVIACFVGGVSSGHGSTTANWWFVVATILVLFVFGFLAKGYRLESRHNPSFNPQQLARAAQGPVEEVPHSGGNTGIGNAGNRSGAI